MRALGIDFGERRVGLALSDPTGTIASPLPTLKRRRGKRPPVKAMERIGREKGVEAVVMGLPLSLDGEETEWTRKIREVGDELGRRLEVPVHYVDERMTSARAERVVRQRLNLPRKSREEKERVDAAAAVLILQSWLDRPGRGAGAVVDDGHPEAVDPGSEEP